MMMVLSSCAMSVAIKTHISLMVKEASLTVISCCWPSEAPRCAGVSRTSAAPWGVAASTKDPTSLNVSPQAKGCHREVLQDGRRALAQVSHMNKIRIHTCV